MDNNAHPLFEHLKDIILPCYVCEGLPVGEVKHNNATSGIPETFLPCYVCEGLPVVEVKHENATSGIPETFNYYKIS